MKEHEKALVFFMIGLLSVVICMGVMCATEIYGQKKELDLIGEFSAEIGFLCTMVATIIAEHAFSHT